MAKYAQALEKVKREGESVQLPVILLDKHDERHIQCAGGKIPTFRGKLPSFDLFEGLGVFSQARAEFSLAANEEDFTAEKSFKKQPNPTLGHSGAAEPLLGLPALRVPKTKGK